MAPAPTLPSRAVYLRTLIAELEQWQADEAIEHLIDVAELRVRLLDDV